MEPSLCISSMYLHGNEVVNKYVKTYTANQTAFSIDAKILETKYSSNEFHTLNTQEEY